MKAFLIILGCLALIACYAMWYLGNNDSKLGELADVWWIPLPLGVVCLAAGFMKKKKAAE